MPLEDKDLLEKFTRHMGHFSWLYIFSRYNDKHLLIMDADLIEKIHAAPKVNLTCQTATPEDYHAKMSDDLQKILVFCRKGELALVRKLSSEYPDCVVTSGTYGFAQVGRDRYPRMIPFPRQQKKAKPAQPVIILATAYADAEFIVKAIHENNGPYFHEYLSRPYISWLQLCHSFQAGRFLNGLMSRFAAGGKLHMLLQGDVLNALLANTNVTPSRFIRYLEESKARVILVKRRDRLFQAILGQLMDRSVERSVWTKKPNKQLQCMFKPGDFVGGLNRYRDVVAQETLLERISSADITTHSVYLEDFVENQEAEIDELASFLGFSPEGAIKPQDYSRGYDSAKNILPAYYRFRGEFLDRTGFHVTPVEQHFRLS